MCQTRGFAANSSLLTHCRHELTHAVWSKLLDDDFVDAWSSGMVLEFADGVKRRAFLRIVTYAADYLEKYFYFKHIKIF